MSRESTDSQANDHPETQIKKGILVQDDANEFSKWMYFEHTRNTSLHYS